MRPLTFGVLTSTAAGPTPALTDQRSALDLVANCGKAGAHVIRSTTKHWKEFLQ